MARQALAALAEQQKLIDDQEKTIRAQAKRIEAQDKSLHNLLMVAKAQQGQLDRLTRGLQTISVMAGVEHKVATAMGLKFVQADVQNPTQPIPEPPAVPPTQSTVEVKTPEAMADVNAPGLVPGSTNDVAADVTTTNYMPGQDIPGPAFKNLQDVTAPIDGTQNPRPLNETKTETDVRVGNPMNPATAFPLRGDFANAQRTGSVQKTAEQIAADASLRTMASLRLARLRMRTGKEQASSDLELGTKIEKDASLSIEMIEHEINTLEAVANNKQVAQAEQRNPRLVPKSASGRQTPPMAGGGQRTAVASTQEESDQELFF